ncbi:hypothetical protein [Archangium lipolyticum]|uniref:hypothetical protein n=1 Tax=Archangium lipolyticum TaxID=2970465 RepID=UPI002149DE7F|nr:hypothetical protein [Archangium lipolyticum]
MAVLACREYVTTQGSESAYQSLEVLGRLQELPRQWVAEKRIKGYFARSLESPEDVIDEDLEEDAIRENTGGVFPCIYVNITFDADTFDRRMLEPWEARFELRLMVDYTPR